MAKAGGRISGAGRFVTEKDGRTDRTTSRGIADAKGANAGGTSNWGLAATFMDSNGLIDIGRVAEKFHMSRGQIAETAGLAQSTVIKSDRQAGPRVQSRVTEILEIIHRVSEWAGGEAQAMAWFRSQPIPALDGRTPEALVKDGRAGAVRDYLDHLALGGYA